MLKKLYPLLLILTFPSIIKASLLNEDTVYDYNLVYQDELTYTIIQRNNTCFDFYSHVYNQSVVDDPNYKWKFMVFDDEGNKTFKDKLKKENIGELIEFCVNETDHNFTFKFGQSSTIVNAAGSTIANSITTQINRLCYTPNNTLITTHNGNITSSNFSMFSISDNNGTTFHDYKLIVGGSTYGTALACLDNTQISVVYENSAATTITSNNFNISTNVATFLNTIYNGPAFRSWDTVYSTGKNYIYTCVVNSSGWITFINSTVLGSSENYIYDIGKNQSRDFYRCSITVDKNNNIFMFAQDANQHDDIYLYTNKNNANITLWNYTVQNFTGTPFSLTNMKFQPMDSYINSENLITLGFQNTTGGYVCWSSTSYFNQLMWNCTRFSATYANHISVSSTNDNLTMVTASNAQMSSGVIEYYDKYFNRTEWRTIRIMASLGTTMSLHQPLTTSYFNFTNGTMIRYSNSSKPYFDWITINNTVRTTFTCPTLGNCNNYGAGTYTVGEYCTFKDTAISHLGDIEILSPCGTLDLQTSNLSYTGRLILRRNDSVSTYKSNLIINGSKVTRVII